MSDIFTGIKSLLTDIRSALKEHKITARRAAPGNPLFYYTSLVIGNVLSGLKSLPADIGAALKERKIIARGVAPGNPLFYYTSPVRAKYTRLKFILSTALLLALTVDKLHAQTDDQALKNFQLSCSRVSDAWKKYNDSLAADFKKKGLAYPPKDIYIRAFKSSTELEVWGRNSETSEYKLVKVYQICALSGMLGPKRGEGDRQVPEGYYFIDDFNPKSEYYLSMLLNYPNYSDNILATRPKKGGDIYIHGGCVTIGCMPITDEGIRELYTLCLNARVNGQENIPVHIFPTRLNNQGWAYLKKEYASFPQHMAFWQTLKPGYDYFEKYHKLLPVMYSPDGYYTN